MIKQTKEQRECDHQYHDSMATYIDFNYCPWCGLPFVKNFDKEDESSDDCQKGGCAD